MLEYLACNNDRNDEELNIKLAKRICQENDPQSVREIINGVTGKDRAIANDCIKVLYEIGEHKPELIKGYVSVFITLLQSKNNRLVWGAMTALSCIAPYNPNEIYSHIELVKKAYKEGSVITVDQSISVFAKVCACGKDYEKDLFPYLLEHLSRCRPKEVAQHAERVSVCVDEQNKQGFYDVLNKRKQDLSELQIRRVNKILHSVNLPKLA